jgi:outer membrane protein OmpA-like peptidoglycan-associated protein
MVDPRPKLACLALWLAACGDTTAGHNLRHPDEHGAARPAGPVRSASQPEPFVDPNKCSYQPPSSPGLAKVDGSSIALAETVFFETGSARIDARSDALLRAVATVLTQNPDIEFVEVAGHADARGRDAQNEKLTSDRARAVMERLVSLQVAEDRLRSVGYAHHCPVDPAETDVAYEKNRRVEIKILRRGGADTGVGWGGCDGAKKKGMAPQPIPDTAPQFGATAKGSAADQSCEPPLIADAKLMKPGPDHLLNGREFFGMTCIGLCKDFATALETRSPNRTATPFLCRALRQKDPSDLQTRFLSHADWLYELTQYSPNGSPERLAFKRRALSTYHAAFGVTSDRGRQVIRMRIGDLYRWSGMFDKAIEWYRELIEHDCEPGEAKVGHTLVALALYQSGPDDPDKLDAAWQELDAAEKVATDGSGMLIPIVRAKILDSRGKREEAKEMLKKVVEFNKSQYKRLKFDWQWTDFHIPDWAR